MFGFQKCNVQLGTHIRCLRRLPGPPNFPVNFSHSLMSTHITRMTPYPTKNPETEKVLKTSGSLVLLYSSMNDLAVSQTELLSLQ